MQNIHSNSTPHLKAVKPVAITINRTNPTGKHIIAHRKTITMRRSVNNLGSSILKFSDHSDSIFKSKVACAASSATQNDIGQNASSYSGDITIIVAFSYK